MNERVAALSPAKQALLQKRLAEKAVTGARAVIPRKAEQEPGGIAIIGMVGRFPGARDLGEFWRNLRAGVESISFFSDEELESADSRAFNALLDAAPCTRDPAYVKARGILADADLFDAAFFAINPKEAEVMDPQQRLFLESAWEALENAGYDPEEFKGAIGVFAGMSNNSYYLANLEARHDLIEIAGPLQTVIGNEKDYLATRVSYKLNLKGPSVAVQTACSTSLVAVSQAVQSLLGGHCDMALAGGVSLTLPQKRGYLYKAGGIRSPDGHCRSFDARARGTVFSNGIGLVVLKRLEDALKDGDEIHAVIKGVGVNNDGAAKASFAAPSVDGQASAIARAYALAGVDAGTITYIEAHGTGTELGDPIEVAALTQAFRAATAATGFCALGSVKSNIGHLDAAAGVAGLIKTALALKHGEIPPSLNYETPNPMIDFATSPFFVNTKLTDWAADGSPRRAGVSSFGVGGTNAHAVLEEAPASEPSGTARPLQLLVLSARTNAALEAATRNLAVHLGEHPGLNLADAAYTLQAGRRAFSHRRALVCGGHDDAVKLLGSADPKKVFTATQDRRDTPVFFLFPGQGAQYLHMGRGLYQAEPVFRAEVDRCADFLQPHLGLDLREALFSRETDQAAAGALLRETRITQPALFVISYALAKLWMAWGIKPKAMLGHSVGEYVAASIAGVFTIEDALRLIAGRARLVQAEPAGAMLAVRLSEAGLGPLLGEGLSLAAVNSGSLSVVAGPFDAIETLEKTLSKRRVAARRLETSHAFHSAMMDPVLEPFTALVRAVKLSPPRIPFVSNVTARWITDAEATNPEYWATHLRQTVRFTDGIAELLKEPGCALLEAGPGHTLSQLVRQHPALTPQHQVLSSLAGGGHGAADRAIDPSEQHQALTNLGRLWLAGAAVNWAGFHAGERRRRVALPTYPFERKRFWVDAPKRAETVSAAPVSAEASAAAANLEIASAPEIVAEPVNPQVAETRTQRILAALKEVLGEVSGLDVADVDPATTFLEMGFDSLFLTQASQAFQKKFGVKITFRQLLEDLPALNDLTAYLDQHLPAGAFGASPEAPVLPSPRIHATTMPEASPASPAFAEAPKPELKAFGPYRPIDKDPAAGLTEAQQKYLAAFIERYTRRTAESKRMAQAHRARLADPRAVAGFKLQWKEMVYPIVSARSAGSRIWDVDGNEYVDLTMGFGVHFFGHSPHFVTEAIQEQLKLGMEIGPQSRLAGRVAELFCEFTGMERATFCNTGSEAVMAALRVARTVTGRTKVVMFAGAYHGIFDEALVRSHNSGGQLRSAPAAPGVPASAVENVLVLDYGDPQSLEIIREQAHELAAVLVEPVQSRHLDLQPWDFLHALRRITEAADVPLIFDEMITGFRIHPGGVQALHGLRADLATYGKVIGGGMPMGVLAGSTRYMNALDGGAWQYGDSSVPDAGMTFFAGTFIRHPLSIAAMWAVLNHLKECGPELQEKLNQKAARLVGGINSELARMHVPLQVPAFGSIFTLNFQQQPRFASMLSFHMRARGVNISDGRQSFLSTAHSDADVDFILRTFREVLEELRAGDFLPQIPEQHPSENAQAPLARRVAPESAATLSAARAAATYPASAKTVPLTPQQQEVWLATQLSEDASRAYIESLTLKLRGPLDHAALECALRDVVSRHDALRTTFSADGQHQHIAAALTLEIPTLDLSALAPEARGARAVEILDAETRTAFDLVRGPLLRIKLLKLEETLHWLVITDHHIVCDGWSMGVILHELGVLYTAHCQGTGVTLPEPMSYAEYSGWQAKQQNSPEQLATEDYWRQKFAASIPVLDLPTDRPRPASRTNRGAVEKLTLEDFLCADLKQVSSNQRCTLLTTLLAGFTAWLYRLSGQTDLVVGMPAAGQLLVGDRSLVGHCVNLLPMRHQLVPEQPFTELLAATKFAILDGFENQSYTFGSLLQKLNISRDPSRVPLVPVIFNLDKAVNQPSFRGLTLKKEANPVHGAKFDLGINVVQTENELLVECNYNTDLFDAETIRRLLGHYQTLLKSMAVDPQRSLASLPLLTGPQRDRLIVKWNQTAADYPRDSLLHGLIEDQVKRTPDAVAVVFEGESLTYGELNHRANHLAHYLRAKGVGADSVVGICTERSIEMVVGLLGILKAGGAYLPLDPDYPKERLEFMIEDARLSVLLTQERLINSLPGHEAETIRLDTDWPAIALESAESPVSGARPQDLAYVIYTSGSTGKPKGAMNTHSGICNRLLWMQEAYGLTPEDRVLQKTPFSFDVSVWEFFWPLLTGARLVMARSGGHRDSRYLIHVIVGEGITTLHFVPPMLAAFLTDKDAGNCRCLKRVICSGEALPFELQEQFFSVLGAELHNLYGPTEAAVDVTSWACQRGGSERVVPIGRPIANTQIYLLDGHLEPAPIGVPGELHIGGASLARGYWGRPELTAEKFIPDPFSPDKGARLYKTGDLAKWRPDGAILYLGRLDHQVKIRGFRIELGEIEAAIRLHPAVSECAVIARERAPGDKSLIAYFIPRQEVNVRDLRELLAAKLPDYMVPVAFVPLDRFPITSNGKLDRNALPAPDLLAAGSENGYVAPEGWIQVNLVEIWEQLLGVRPIGIRDNFFERGGHSLLAVRMCSRVEEVIGRKLAPAALFQGRTIEHLSNVLSQQSPPTRPSPLVKVRDEGSKPPLFFLHGDLQGGGLYCVNLARHMKNDRPFYAIDPHGLDGRPVPPTIEEMAASRLKLLLETQPEGPYFLGGYCNGGLVAYEMAHQLELQGKKVGCVVILLAGEANLHHRFLRTFARIWGQARRLDEAREREIFLKFVHLAILTKYHWVALRKEMRDPERSLLIWERLQRFFGWMRRSTVWKRRFVGESVAPDDAPDNVGLAYVMAGDGYIPPRYDGRAFLLQETGRPGAEWLDPNAGWHKVARRLTIHVVPGGHFTALSVHENIAAVGAQVDACLAEAESELQLNGFVRLDDSPQLAAIS